MTDWLRMCLAGGLYYSGLVRFARWWTTRAGRYLVVLNYHRASGGNLRRHLLYLRRYYRILHLEAALEELYSPDAPGVRRDRRPLLALTFDDGYADSYTHAFALAGELHVPLTIFLIPGYIESAHCFWWLEGEYLSHHAQVDEVKIDGRTYRLSWAREREALAQAIYARACQARTVRERETFLTSAYHALGATSSKTAEERRASPLTWGVVREMAKSAWISFGAHTMNHPVLAYLTDPAEIQFEVEQGRAMLEQRLERQVRSFAYPLGKPEHIGEEAMRAVRRAGFRWALTTIRGMNTPQSDPHQLRRIGVAVDQHWLLVAAQAAGVWGFLSGLSHRQPYRRRGKHDRRCPSSDARSAHGDVLLAGEEKA